MYICVHCHLINSYMLFGAIDINVLEIGPLSRGVMVYPLIAFALDSTCIIVLCQTLVRYAWLHLEILLHCKCYI